MLTVREGAGIPPRGSTPVAAGDRLYVLASADSRAEVEALFAVWQGGPMPTPLRAVR